jgi:hypothetical protein
MRTSHKIALIAASITGLSAGCTSAHGSSEPQAGIYDLSVRGEVDRCSPTRATGTMGAVGLATAGDVLSFSAPDPTRGSMLQVSLSRPLGYHDESTVNLRGCSGATLDRSFTIVSSDESSISVAYRERWIGIDTCGDAMRAIMPAAPATDCEAELTLDYALTEACGETCEVGILATGPACLCD